MIIWVRKRTKVWNPDIWGLKGKQAKLNDHFRFGCTLLQKLPKITEGTEDKMRTRANIWEYHSAEYNAGSGLTSKLKRGRKTKN